MKFVHFEQDSSEWHAWRDCGIGASEAGVIVESPHAKTTQFQLYLVKTQQAEPADLDGNPYVMRGKNREDEVRSAAREYLKTRPEYGPGISVEPACAEHDVHSHIHASFDGLIDQQIPVELKFLSDGEWDLASKLGDQSPAYQLYRWQVMQQCLVAGTDHGWLMLYKEGGYLIPFRMTFSQTELDELLALLNTFWDMVVNFVAPARHKKNDYFAPDHLPEQMRWRALSRQYGPLRKRRATLEAQIATIKEQEQPYLEQYVELMGEYQKARFAGIQVNRVVTSGSVDYQAYAQALEGVLAKVDAELQRQGITLPDADSFRKEGRTTLKGGLYTGKTLDDRVSEVSTSISTFF